MRVALDPIHADDGEQHVVFHPRELLGRQQISGGRAEELPRCLRVGRLHGRDVDDGVHPDEGGVETLTGGHVDAARARDHDGL